MNGAFNVATWNTEWATLATERGRRVATKLAALDVDIVVVTEGARELLPAYGNAIDAGSDWGYALKSNRRKVILWSRLPISLENVGETGAALGRLAVATVETPSGLVSCRGLHPLAGRARQHRPFRCHPLVGTPPIS